MKPIINKRIILVAILLLCLYLCCACEFFPEENFHPKDGLWYCDELQVQITFGEYPADPIDFYTNKGYLGVSDEEYYRSHIIINGQKLRCGANTPTNRSTLIISYDDIRYNDNHPGVYSIGEELFRGTALKLRENEYVVQEESTGKIYTFVRIG